jgi:hypothetical protein
VIGFQLTHSFSASHELTGLPSLVHTSKVAALFGQTEDSESQTSPLQQPSTGAKYGEVTASDSIPIIRRTRASLRATQTWCLLCVRTNQEFCTILDLCDVSKALGGGSQPYIEISKILELSPDRRMDTTSHPENQSRYSLNTLLSSHFKYISLCFSCCMR